MSLVAEHSLAGQSPPSGGRSGPTNSAKPDSNEIARPPPRLVAATVVDWCVWPSLPGTRGIERPPSQRRRLGGGWTPSPSPSPSPRDTTGACPVRGLPFGGLRMEYGNEGQFQEFRRRPSCERAGWSSCLANPSAVLLIGCGKSGGRSETSGKRQPNHRQKVEGICQRDSFAVPSPWPRASTTRQNDSPIAPFECPLVRGTRHPLDGSLTGHHAQARVDIYLRTVRQAGESWRGFAVLRPRLHGRIPCRLCPTQPFGELSRRCHQANQDDDWPSRGSQTGAWPDRHFRQILPSRCAAIAFR